MRRRFEGDGVRDKFVDLSRRDWMRASAQMTCGVAAIAALGGSACVLSACAQHDDSTPTTVEKPERVIAYVSVDDALARGMLAACTAATGIAIDPVFDSEVSKTTGLENRIRAERDRPRADLFWSSESFALVKLASEGLLAQLPSDLCNAWNPAYCAADRTWIAFSARVRVIVRRSDRPEHAAISQWADLSSVATASTVAIADPRFGTTRAHLAALDNTWSRARAEGGAVPTMDAWLDGLRARGVRVMLGGNAACVDAVATGECAYGCTDSDDALAAIARGLPIEMTLPRTLPIGVPGGGTMLIPNTVGLIAGRETFRAKDSTAAARVAAWLVSKDAERLMCASPSRNIALGAGVECDPAFVEADPQQFDLNAASARAVDGARAAHARLSGVAS